MTTASKSQSPLRTPPRSPMRSPVRSPMQSSPMRSPYRSSPMRSPMHHQVHHSFSESLMEERIENAESIINKWSSSGSDEDSASVSCNISMLFSGENRQEAQEYVHAVNELQTAMHNILSMNPASKKLRIAQNLMQVAMKQLEKEFYRILKTNRQYLQPECVSVRSARASRFSSTSNSVSGSDYEDDDSDGSIEEDRSGKGPDVDAMSDLKLIADCMISNGYAKECVRIYKTIRKSIVDEGLYQLGLEKFSFAQVQKMEWEVLEGKIRTWLRAVKIAVRTLFYGERILCDHVFSVSTSITESCFAEITREGAMNLFVFPENVAKCKKATEKMFRTLDMYETISDLYAEIEMIFYFESTTAVRSQTIESLAKLGEAVRIMLADFESAIQKDVSKSALPGGGVHHLSRYVMNYLSFLADYSGPISDIIGDTPFTVGSPLPESYFAGQNSVDGVYSSPISMRLAWLVLLLLAKIDGKAQLYKDVGLTYLFLTNNLQYVIGKVRNSSLKLLLGDEWLSKHEATVMRFASSYEKLAWGKVWMTLPQDPTAITTIDQAKVFFNKFNVAFEEAYKKQTSWVVTDPKLRDEIKVSVASKLVPEYREIYNRYRTDLVRDSVRESFVVYAPDDLGNYLSDLFFGGGSGSGSSNNSVSSHTRGRASRH